MTVAASDISLQVVEHEAIGPEGSSTIDACLRIANHGDEPLDQGWRLYYSLGLTPRAEEQRVQQVRIEGRYGYLEPTESWRPLEPGDAIEIPIENWLFNGMPLRSKQGFHFVFASAGDNRPEPAPPITLAPSLLPVKTLPNEWIRDMSPSCDVEPDTASHRWHKQSAIDANAAPQSIIPAPAESEITTATVQGSGLTPSDPALLSTLAEFFTPDGIPVQVKIETGKPPEAYHLQVTAKRIDITAGSEGGAFYAAQSLRQLIDSAEGDRGKSISLPCGDILDAPAFAHRGLFLDLTRHAVSPAAIRQVIRAMSAYKMNVLQLGISNDEGFRLEIPGLPELTDVGARRAFHADSEDGTPRALFPAWGDGPEESQDFISGDEFVQLLKFAAEHHVNLVLELNLPGHANAMIRAMAASGRYQVLDSNDQSTHRSAQGYTHNVMNVCLPGTYALAADILQAIAGYYKQADVPLRALHLGGDEVPAGAWLNSPAVHQSSIWNADWQLDEEADRAAATLALNQHYASEITKLADRIMPGVELGFWHEMSPALPTDADTYVTGWTTETGDRDLIEAVLDRGQRLVIANASFLYLDMPYALSSEEPGLPWAAYIDESLIYHFSPLANWGITERQRDQVQGLQAQLWSETIYSEEIMFYHLFPRLLSVAERGWAAETSMRNWPAFTSALGTRELNYLETLEIPFRVPPPGAAKVADKIEANTAFPGLVIRYTLDGSEPDSGSMTYNAPVTLASADVLKMAAFTPSGKTRSRTTTLPGDF